VRVEEDWVDKDEVALGEGICLNKNIFFNKSSCEKKEPGIMSSVTRGVASPWFASLGSATC